VSDYGIGQCRGLFWTQALAGAVACIALAVALGDAKPSIPVASIAWFFIVAIELARIYQLGRALRTDPRVRISRIERWVPDVYARDEPTG
jgi:hypothetical protein